MTDRRLAPQRMRHCDSALVCPALSTTTAEPSHAMRIEIAQRKSAVFVNPDLTTAGETSSTKSRLRTIFLLSAGAFLEKCQVAKFDLIGKSFLTVILCYRIDAPLLNQDWHGPGRLVVQGFAIASEVPASKREAP